MLLQSEAAIVEYLQAIPGLPEQSRIVPWPDRPLDFNRAQNINSIYVRFAGLKLAAGLAGSGYHGLQEGQISFELRLVMKDLRSHAGAYEMLEKCQRHLTGFKLPAQDGYSFKVPGLQLLQADLIERVADSGQWDWGAIFVSDLIYEQPKGGF